MLFGLIFIGTSIWVAVEDFKSLRISNYATVILALTGVVQVWLKAPDQLFVHALASIGVGLALWQGTEWLYRRSGKDFLGLGDVKLISALTLWVGPSGLAPAILISSLSGLAFLLLTRRVELPFGPFLCLGFLLVWLHDNAPAIFPT